MPLTPQDVAALSRMVDDAAALPGAVREAWLQARPQAQRHLVPHARAMLEALQGDDVSGDATPGLPALPGMAALPGDPVQPQAGDLIGPYRLVELIGRGGMGRVWRAARADGLYEREVALKLPDFTKSPELPGRMARERQIGARLEHPHIARLYDAGVDEAGRPFLVMEWVRGRNLLDHADHGRLSRRQRLELLLQACAATAHAHAQLVVHRDIKPSNMLVDEAGQLKLLDFGVARWLAQAGDPAHGPTPGDDARGTHTPGYAAPEQRAGGAVTIATDIYALGAVAHQLLLGRLPAGPSALDADARRELGPDLAAVLGRALREAPQERYSSVDRLADDLRRVVEGRAAEAAQAGTARRLGLFVRRHRRALAAGLAGVVVLAGASGLLLHQRLRAQQQAERLAQAREFLLDMLEDAEPMEGQGDAPITAQQLLESALQRARSGFAGQDALRGNVLAEFGIMMRRLNQPERAQAVLAEAVQQLQASAEADDPALHIASAQLALQWLDAARPDADRAERLASGALAGCSADSVRCARARVYARAALRSVALRQGEVTRALDHARMAVKDSERAFGPAHAETAMTRLHWAQVLRNAGDLQAAGGVLAQAVALAASTPLRAADRRQLQTWSVVLDTDLGRAEQAIAQARSLLAQATAPDDRSVLHRLVAQSLFVQGRFGASAQAAVAAVEAATQARDEWHEAFARLALARAQAMLGEHAAAATGITQVQASLQAQGLEPVAVERLRAQRLAGEIALRAGDDARARALLQPLPALHRGTAGGAPVAPVDLAQVLDLLGVLERRAGRAPAAARLHDEAGGLLRAALPEAHPLRLRHEWDAALAAGGDDAAALQRYLAALPADSGWRALLEPRAGAAKADARMVW